MPRRAWALAAAVAVLAGCGDGRGRAEHAAPAPPASPQALARLGLTRDVPAGLTAACRKLAAKTAARAIACPPVVPKGAWDLSFATELDGGYAMDMQSPSIDRESNGHWAIGAGRPEELRDILRSRSLGMRVAARRAVLGRTVATLYVAPPYDAAPGMYAGHVVYSWRAGGTEHWLTLHNPRNRERARVMAEAHAAATLTRPPTTAP